MKDNWVRVEGDHLWITSANGQQKCYIKHAVLARRGAFDLEISHAGQLIQGDESKLRALPQSVIVKQLGELLPITSMPKPGCQVAYFQFVRS